MSGYNGLMRLSPTARISKDKFVEHDKELIKKSIETLVKTHKGSRIYDPDYGTSLHRIPHEGNSERMRNIVKNEIRAVILKYEPRVQLINIDAFASGELEQEMFVTIAFKYIEYDDEDLMEIRIKTETEWIERD